VSGLTDTEAVVLGVILAPWAVVGLVAIIRGYSIKVWREHHQGEEES
jgi:hypothetical protein